MKHLGVAHLMEKAEEDWGSAKLLLEVNSPYYNVIGFHLQQYIEKALKAYLVSRDYEPPRTHELSTLVSLCTRFDDDFKSLDLPEIDTLNYFGVTGRYENVFEFNRIDIEHLYSVALQCKNLIEKKLPE